MFLTLLAAAAAASAPIHTAPLHTASVANVNATYSTQSTVHFDEIGPIAAARQVQPVCRWQADLVVHRAVAGQDGAAIAAAAKPIHRLRPVSGTYAGACANVKGAVTAEIARHSAKHADEAVAVARQDSAVLASEIDALHRLPTRG